MNRFGKFGKRAKFFVLFAVVVVLLFSLYSKFIPSKNDTSNMIKSEKQGNNKLQQVLAAQTPALVQKNFKFGQASSVQVALSKNVTAGNLLVVGVTQWEGAVSSVTDNRGNSYKLVAKKSAIAGEDFVQLYYAENAKGGATTVTVAFTSWPDYSVGIYEYAGIIKTSPLDKVVSQTGPNNNKPNGGTLTGSMDNELYFVIGVDDWGDNSLPTPGSGYTLLHDQEESETHERYYTEYRISPMGSYQTNFTIARESYWAVIGATFKPEVLPTPTPTPTPIPTYSINGTVANSQTNNPISGVSIKLSQGSTQVASVTTGSSGNYGFSNLYAGSYTVTAVLPSGMKATTSLSQTVTVGPNQVVNFGMVDIYTISGNVFNDANKNKILDSGELKYSGPVNIAATGGKVTVNADNSYKVDELQSGTYVVSAVFSPGLLKGYQLIEPKPPSFSVTVGDTCSVANASTGATCDLNGNITNLNFAVSDSWPWMQFYGLGTRFDNGINNPLPASTTCGGGSFAQGTTTGMGSPGIYFTGDTTADYGQGTVSNKGWSVGGITYPEVYSSVNPIRTSAAGLRSAAAKAGYTVVQLNSVSACTNPANHCNLQGQPKGFYATTGDLTLDSPLNISNGNYVIVADGNITLTKNITVAQGATLIIAAGRDIIVDGKIHPSQNACPVASGQLQGIFSAGRNFVLQGNNGDCTQPDTMLNMDGSLIVNAARNGGVLQNQRDLCSGNRSYPSLTITARPDFILNLPAFIPQQNMIMREETP